MTFGDRDAVGLVLNGEIGKITRVLLVHDKGYTAHMRGAKVEINPGWRVGTGQHLAHPQDFCFAFHILWSDTMGDAVAAPSRDQT